MPDDLRELIRLRTEAMNEALADDAGLSAFVRRFYDPGVVMDMGALEGTITGWTGVERFIRGQAAIVESMRLEPEDVIESNGQVIVGFRLSGRAKSTGLPLDFRFAHLITLREDKILHVKLFADTTAALRAASGNP